MLLWQWWLLCSLLWKRIAVYLKPGANAVRAWPLIQPIPFFGAMAMVQLSLFRWYLRWLRCHYFSEWSFIYQARGGWMDE